MAKQHTPAPWFIETTGDRIWIGVEKAAGGKVGDVIVSLEHGEEYTAGHNDLANANARLIAQAPAMLEALRNLAVFTERQTASWPDKPRSLADARAVIAAATGEAP